MRDHEKIIAEPAREVRLALCDSFLAPYSRGSPVSCDWSELPSDHASTDVILAEVFRGDDDDLRERAGRAIFLSRVRLGEVWLVLPV